MDAAIRQLEMAIRLFLSSEDSVCIHTLTAAAHQILRDLSKVQGKESAIKDKMLEMVVPEKKKEIRDMMNKAENFFKHADRDPDQLLKFYLEQTDFLLWDVCAMYQALSGEIRPLMYIYYAWYFSKYPCQLADKKIANRIAKQIEELNIRYEDKALFLEMLPHVIELKASIS